ncbi:translation initiation factor IF-3 [Candidatus Margulisiibacteriota bacterium]
MHSNRFKGRKSFGKRYIINEQIKANEVRLIDEKGTQIGVVSIEQARSQAEAVGLDLLLISAEAKPPVCRIVDFGQFRYQQQKKDKQSKKSSKTQVLKELKMSPKISEHDYNVRLTSAKKFLGKKYTVKLAIFFKGREITHPQLGKDLINRFLDDVKEVGNAACDMSTSGRIFSVMINPNK